MGQRATEVDNGLCRIDGDAREEGDVLATMRIGGNMGDCRVGEEDKRKCRDMPTRRYRLVSESCDGLGDRSKTGKGRTFPAP